MRMISFKAAQFSAQDIVPIVRKFGRAELARKPSLVKVALERFRTKFPFRRPIVLHAADPSPVFGIVFVAPRTVLWKRWQPRGVESQRVERRNETI